jgi:hypothetical protein
MMQPDKLMLVGLAALAACTQAPVDRETARDDMQPYLAECSQKHGYTPSQSDTLGPNQLGAGEREWRGCVYRGIETIVIPKAREPENFRTLISTDQRLTNDIAAGTATRAQRRQRIEAVLDRALDREAELEKEANLAALQRTQSMTSTPATGYASSSDAMRAYSAQEAAIRNSRVTTVRGALR